MSRPHRAMGRHHMRSRRQKRQWVADCNAMSRVLVGVSRINAADVQRQHIAMQTALDGLLSGHDGLDCWRSLADACNMAETLAGMGLGSGDDARQVIADAQEALAYVMQERKARSTWALRADERDELRDRLQWLISVHLEQLRACSYAEFERAYRTTAERVQQARAGNGGRDVVVVGEIAGNGTGEHHA